MFNNMTVTLGYTFEVTIVSFKLTLGFQVNLSSFRQKYSNEVVASLGNIGEDLVVIYDVDQKSKHFTKV